MLISTLRKSSGSFGKLFVKSLSCKSQLSNMTCENKGVALSYVVTELEKFAPKNLAETWDNTGLLVEPYTPRMITKILLTNDLTEDVVKEAINVECEMVISYHPPIFTPLKSVTQSKWKERIVSALLEKQISLYSPHTSWDSIQGGVNDWLASAFGAQLQSTPLKPNDSDPTTGAGRLLHLQTKITITEVVENVKKITGLKHVRLAIGKDKSMTDNIEKIALCAGSGSSVLSGVDADLYLTGEMLHHDILDATQKNITVILTNHSDSERGFLKVFSTTLRKMLHNQVQVLVSNCDKDPLITV